MIAHVTKLSLNLSETVWLEEHQFSLLSGKYMSDTTADAIPAGRPDMEGGEHPAFRMLFLGIVFVALGFVGYSVLSDLHAAGGRVSPSARLFFWVLLCSLPLDLNL